MCQYVEPSFKSILWSSMMFLIVMLLIANSLAAQAPNKSDCSSGRLKQIDSSIVKLYCFGRGGRKFPANRAELKTFCKDTDRIINEFEQYINNCYKTDNAQFAKILAYSAKQSFKSICGKKRTKKQNTLLDNAQCINEIVAKVDCLEDFANKTRTLIQYRMGNEKGNYVCCNFVDMLKCFDKSISVPCMKEEAKEALIDMIASLTNDAINFGCGEYNEHTDRCDNLGPPPKSKYDKSIKVNKKTRSVILIGLELLENLANTQQ